MAISEKEHQKRIKLYKQGLTDSKIGEKVGLSEDGIFSWRKRNDLPTKNSRGNKISKKENKKRIKLYHQNFNDKEIAEKIGLTRKSIEYWRNENNLKPNAKNCKLTKKEYQERMELYNKGLTDKEIAEKLKMSAAGIFNWREKNNLEANKKNYKISKEKEEKILYYYNQELSDRKIAYKIGISATTIRNYRYVNDLPSHYPSNNFLEPKEHKKRLKLYNQGFNDRKIAEKVGLSRVGITNWRKRNNLPSKNK